MKKKEIQKKLGLSAENFNFYVQMKKIWKIGRDNYEYDPVLETQILEKSTVFKYYFNDSFHEDIRDFVKFVKYTGPVRHLSKKEMKEYEKQLKERDRKKKKGGTNA